MLTKPESVSRLILLNKLLEDGNTLYRRNRFEDAAHRYQYAVKRLPPIQPQLQQQQQLTQQEDQLFEQLRIHLLLNLSRCKRKMGDLESAAETAGQVLPLLLNILLERCPNWYCLLLLYIYREYVIIRKMYLLVKKLH